MSHENPRNKKCVHVLASLDYAPQLCEITMPRIEAYAHKIGADFNRITERKFPDYPINYERMQIYEAGKKYLWNLNIDADVLIGRSLIDLTSRIQPGVVGTAMWFKLSSAFAIQGDPAFKEISEDVGLVDMFNVTNRLTHAVWKPLPGPFEQYRNYVSRVGERKVSEYCMSVNFHRHRYKFAGIFQPGDHVHHFNYTTRSAPRQVIAEAKELLASWGES